MASAQTNSLIGGILFAGLAVATGGSALVVSTAWLVGSTIGSLLSLEDSSDTQEGPRITEFRNTSSRYGVPIPRGYGATRIAGNVIWAGPVVENQVVTTDCTTIEGPLSGIGISLGETEQCQTVVTYKYRQSWFVALCEGPIADTPRVWANGKLIYDLTGVSDGRTSRTDDVGQQGPPPILRTIVGDADQLDESYIRYVEEELNDGLTTDQLPAYRGIAGIMFIDVDLEPFGYRIPSISAEVLFNATNPSVCKELAAYRNGELITRDDQTFILPYSPQEIVTFQAIDGVPYRIRMNPVKSRGSRKRKVAWDDWAEWEVLHVGTDRAIWVVGRPAGETEKWGVRSYDEAAARVQLEYVFKAEFGRPIGIALPHLNDDLFVAFEDGYYYSTSYLRDPNTRVRSILGPRKVRDTDRGLGIVIGRTRLERTYFATLHARTIVEIGNPDVDYTTYLVFGYDGVKSTTLDRADGLVETGATNEDLARQIEQNVDLQFPVIDPETGERVEAIGGGLFVEPSDDSLILVLNVGGNTALLVKFDVGTLRFTRSARVSYRFEGKFDVQIKNGSFNGIWEFSAFNRLYRFDTLGMRLIQTLNSGVQWSDCGGFLGDRTLYLPLGSATVVLQVPGRPYTGFWSSGPIDVPLRDVVESVALNEQVQKRYGLDASDLELDELEGLTLRGIVYANQQTVRGNLRPLQQAFFLDYFESDGMIKFRHRPGQQSIATVPEDDLSARDAGSEQTARITISRQSELELPREVAVTFTDHDLDYESGVQRATRQTTDSQAKVSLVLPLLLDNTEALRIAQTLMDNTWIERTAYQVALPPKYLFLEPSDVFEVETGGATYSLRVSRVAIGVNRVVLVEAAAEDLALYDNRSVAQLPPGAGYTEKIDDSPFSAYAVEIPVQSFTSFPGNQRVVCVGLFTEEGTSVDSVTVARTDQTGSRTVGRITRSVVGGVLTPDSALLTTPDSRNVDRTNLIVQLFDDETTLRSATPDQLRFGLNHCVVGQELIQFGLAEPLDEGVWRLSNLRRGIGSTEREMARHAPGETVMMVEDVMFDTAFREGEGSAAFYDLSTETTEARTGARLNGNSFGLRKVANLRVVPGVQDATLIAWDPVDDLNRGFVDGEDLPLSRPERYQIVAYDAELQPIRNVITSDRTYLYVDGSDETGQGGDLGSPLIAVRQLTEDDQLGPAAYLQLSFRDDRHRRVYLTFDRPSTGLIPFWGLDQSPEWSRVETEGADELYGRHFMQHNLNSGSSILAFGDQPMLVDAQVRVRMYRGNQLQGGERYQNKIVLRATQRFGSDGQLLLTGIIVGLSEDGETISLISRKDGIDTLIAARDIPRVVAGGVYDWEAAITGYRVRWRIWRVDTDPPESRPDWQYVDPRDGPYPLFGHVGYGADLAAGDDRLYHLYLAINGHTLL